MAKRNKKIISYIVSLAIVFSAISFPRYKALGAESNNNFNMIRISGDNRYETSAKISEEGWIKAENIIIVNGENYSDALCAAPLAKKYDGPILLTSKDSLNEKVLNEISRLGGKKAIIIGGIEDVSDNIVNELKEKGVNDVERIFGRNKQGTSVKIAEKMGQVDKIVIASSEKLADALSIASIAAYKGIPILLTSSDKLDDEVKNYIASKRISTSYLVGGVSVVSDEVKAKLPRAERIWGQDRYDTNKNIIDKFADMDFSNLYFAQGENGFADALAGSALAAKTGSPIILTNNTLKEESKKLVKANMRIDSKVTLLGGEKLIENSVLDGIDNFRNYDKDGTVYGEEGKATEINENIKIAAKNVALKNIKTPYSVSIKGDNATIENAEIGGTLYVDPGEKGTSNIKNIKAKKVVVLSGAQESNHAENLITDDLIIRSKNPNNNPRFELKGNSSIRNTVVQTASILDAKSGSFGNLQIEKSENKTHTVELRGNFDKPITVTGDVQLKTVRDTKVSKVIIAPKDNEKIVLNGVYDYVEITKGAKVEIAPSAKITGKLIIASDAEISADKTAVVNKIEVATENKDSKIVVNGNFGDIEINKAAKIVVASGNADIKANVKADIDVSKGASVVIKGDKTNAVVKGEGKVQIDGSVAQTTTSTSTVSGGGASGNSSGGGASSGGGSSNPGGNSSSQNEINAPVLNKDPNKEYGLIASNVISGSRIYLYKYNKAKNEYECDKNNWFEVKDGDGKTVEINYQCPGNFKVTQFINGKESPMSNECILKPEKLNTMTSDNDITVINALLGANITLYDAESGKFISNMYPRINKDTVECIFKKVKPGKYYVTQNFNDVESDKSDIVEITNIYPYIVAVNINDENSIEVVNSVEFTATPSAISLRKFTDGEEIGENLVNTTKSAISFENRKIFKIELTENLSPNSGYKLIINDEIYILNDKEAPYVYWINSVDNRLISIRFNEELDIDTAMDIKNYEISDGIKIQKVSYSSSDRIVSLRTTEQETNKKYTITINGIKDLHGNEVSNLECNFICVGTKADIAKAHEIK